MGRVAGQNGDDEAQEIELGGETAGWVGRRPEEIEGGTNPTLTLTPEETYRVTWENVDGAPHNFAIEDDEGEPVVESEILDEQGETQTVEFTASEVMSAYLCQVHPNSMRADLEVTDAESDQESDDEPDRPVFQQEVFEEERGDVARVTFTLVDASEVEMTLGSEALNYLVSFTAVDGDDDEEVTVALDTFAAGRGHERAVSAVADEDGIEGLRRETPRLSAPLDVEAYPIRAFVDGRPVDSAVLVLQSRKTRAAHAAVAPRSYVPAENDAFFGGVTRRNEVAAGDWAVLEVEASGLYATLDGREAFTDESLGYDLTIEQTDVINADPESVPIEDVHVVVDESEDRFFAAVDSTLLQTDETYEATFAITDANPYVSTDEREEVAAEFTVVDRAASFDAESDGLSVPAGEATLSGRSTVAPGTVLVVSVSGRDDGAFQKTTYTTVEDDGSWSVSFDFSDLEPGTTFSARVVGLGAEVEGEITASES